MKFKKAKSVAIVLLASVLLTGCNFVEGIFSDTLVYFTNVNIGFPENVETISEDKYAYNTLSDEEKKVYDQFLDAILNFKENVPISLLDEECLNRIFQCIMADYGELFWVSGYEYKLYSRFNQITGITVTPGFTMDATKRDKLRQEIDGVCESWLSELPVEASDYEKSKFVYEKLIAEVDYDLEAEENQNIISVFLNKKSVCQGYACAASYMFSKIGIPSFVVTGIANNENHAWNIVMLEGEYYCFDATWGNSSYRDGVGTSKYIDYGYLNTTSEQLSKNHSVDVEFAIPDCTATTNNYFVKEGLYFESWDVSLVGQAISNAYNSGNESVSIKFSNPDSYSQAVSYIIGQRRFVEFCPGLSSITYLDAEDVSILTLKFR